MRVKMYGMALDADGRIAEWVEERARVAGATGLPVVVAPVRTGRTWPNTAKGRAAASKANETANMESWTAFKAGEVA